MKLKQKKTFRIIMTALGAAVIAIFAVSVFKYYQVRNSHQAVVATVIPVIPLKGIKLGDTVLAGAELKCPWNRRPVSATVTPGKGSQTVNGPRISIKRVGWGYWTWNVSAKIQPFENGKIEGGKINIELNQPLPGDEQKEVTCPIPSLEAGTVDAGVSPELAIAGKIVKKVLSSKLLIISLIILLLIIFIVLFYLFRKKSSAKAVEIPPWCIALLEFNRLRVQLKENQLTPVACVLRLSDIIRTYLEKRFSLHAPTQTTAEFLEDLRSEKSPLNPDDKDFLADFMTASDLVKFANLPADAVAIENAINKAEHLVQTTKPVEKKVDER